MLIIVGPDGTIDISHLCVHLGEQFLDLLKNRVDAPDEHTAVPQKISTLDELLCCRLVGLLGERFYTEDAARKVSVFSIVFIDHLDVPVSGFGPRRLNAHRDQLSRFVGDPDREVEDAAELFLNLAIWVAYESGKLITVGIQP